MPDLTREAIEKLEELSLAAVKPSTLSVPGRRTTAIVNKGGDISEWVTPARDYRAQTVQGLCDLVRDIAETSIEPDVIVMVGEASVCALFDENNDRDDRVRLKLTQTPSFVELGKLAAGEAVKQQDTLVELLRTTFADAFTPSSLLPTVRSLKIRSSSQSGSEVQHGRETRDLSIENELTGADGPVPERITLQTFVFEELAWLREAKGDGSNGFDVDCALIVNAATGEFRISPLEGEVNRVLRQAVDEIALHIREQLNSTSNVRVISGVSPGL